MRVGILLSMLMIIIMTASTAHAQCGPDELRLRNTVNGECYCDFGDAFPSLEVEIRVVPRYRPDGLEQVHLRLDNIPAPSSAGEVTFEWFADTVEGEPGTGITLSWDEATSNFVVGKMILWMHQVDWLPIAHRIEVLDAWIRDDREEQHELEDSGFTIHCDLGSENCGCLDFIWDPPDSWFDLRYPWPASGTTLPMQFDLEFEVESWACSVGYAAGYEGSVHADGELVAEITGSGEGNHQIPLDFSGLPMGSQVTVTIYASMYGGGVIDDELTLIYTIDESVAAQRSSWSALKAKY